VGFKEERKIMYMIEVNEQVLVAMGDDISKEMYLKLVDYSNGSVKDMESIIKSVMLGEDLIGFMQAHRDSLYIFGAGMLGQDFADTWSW